MRLRFILSVRLFNKVISSTPGLKSSEYSIFPVCTCHWLQPTLYGIDSSLLVASFLVTLLHGKLNLSVCAKLDQLKLSHTDVLFIAHCCREFSHVLNALRFFFFFIHRKVIKSLEGFHSIITDFIWEDFCLKLLDSKRKSEGRTMANSNNATPHHNMSKNNDTSNIILFNDNQSLHCLPYVTLVAVGVDYVYVSDLVVTIFNFSFAIFAFLVNLAVIVTIIRTPSLHRPVNALLCGLAAADCLTGLVAQPVHASWRFLLHHIADPCKLVHLYYATKSLPFLLVGCTFLNLTITSMERLYAVFKPLAYSAKITLQGMFKFTTDQCVLPSFLDTIAVFVCFHWVLQRPVTWKLLLNLSVKLRFIK